MSNLDFGALLQEVSPEAPSGSDLRHDPKFRDLELAAAGKPEQRMGDSVKPAEEPDWLDVKDRAVELLRRTKDLRVAVQLTRSLLRIDGAAGLNQGVSLIAGLLERYWDSVYPQLDPEDGNDPTFRLNSLANLAGLDVMVRALREMPLVTSRVLGRFSLRDMEIADGTITRSADAEGEAPDQTTISAAFTEADAGELKSTADAIRGALEGVTKILHIVDDKAGNAGSLDLGRLTSTLKSIDAIFTEQLARRSPDEGGSAAGVSGGPASARGAGISGEVASRDDVIRLLDKACDYFRRHEPSSPVPLLLERAKKLVRMDFLEIVRDMAPSGLSEVISIGGITIEEDTNNG
jgi:type VI secretion system protein ImpA